MTQRYRKLGPALILALALATSACQTIRYKFGTEANGGGDEILHHSWVAGFIEHKSLKTKNYCPNGVHKITSERSIFNFVPYLNFVWMPRSVAIECSDIAMGGSPASGQSSSGSSGSNTNNNTNNITIQISPDMIKKP